MYVPLNLFINYSGWFSSIHFLNKVLNNPILQNNKLFYWYIYMSIYYMFLIYLIQS